MFQDKFSGMMKKVLSIGDSIEKMNAPAFFMVINLIGISFYFFTVFKFDYINSLETTMWIGSDTYMDASKFFFGQTSGDAPKATELRPMVYPLVLGCIRLFSKSAYAVWAVQFLLWIISLNLILCSIKLIKKNNMLLIIPGIMFATNISLIVHTCRGMVESETMVVFLISLWVFFFIRFTLFPPEPKSIFVLVLVLGLLALVKPVFEIHLLLFISYILCKNIRKPKVISVIAIALLPILFQLLFMFKYHNVFGLSTIGGLTFKRYLAAKVFAIEEYGSVENKFIERTRLRIQQLNYPDIFKYLLKHPYATLTAYTQNVISENMLGASPFAGKLISITQKTNSVYFCIHFALFPLILHTVLHAGNELRIKILFLYIFLVLIFFTSGVSFWVGDRLTVTALPLWLTGYSIVAKLQYDTLRKVKTGSMKILCIDKQILVFICSSIMLILSLFVLYMKGLPNLTSY